MAANKTLSLLAELAATFRRFSAYSKPDRLALGVGFVVIIGIAATNTAMIWLIGSLFDLLQQGDFDSLNVTALLFALMVLINQGTHFSDAMLADWIGLRFVGRLRGDLLARLMRLSLPGTARFSRGDLLTRLGDDVDRTQNLVIQVPFDLASHLCIFTFYMAMLFWIDAGLALIAVILSPLFILHQRLFAKPKRRASDKVFEKNASLVAFEETKLRNLRGIASFAVEPIISAMHAGRFERLQHWGMKNAWLNAWFNSSFAVLIYFCALAVTIAGFYDVRGGYTTLGQLVSFLLYLGYLSTPVRGFAQLGYGCQEGLASAGRILDIFDAKQEIAEKPGATPLKVTAGRIDFNDVSFGYADQPDLFRHLDLTIEGGTTVALVGTSGVGKSTLASLLLRLYDPRSGQISIDGTDLRDMTLDSLRKDIAVVWQESFVVDDTVRANLLLVNPDADEEKLIEACKASYAWEFITTLEQGLDTVIGPQGVELSAGQQQRLSIAQAFVCDAPIMILDEPSSALDSQAEQEIVAALARLRSGRTTLIIAHRYSSIRAATKIIYFNTDGSVTIGRHEDLYKSHPEYRQALEWQTDFDVDKNTT